jgi:RNA polymerase sigma factor (sigma-70 family)
MRPAGDPSGEFLITVKVQNNVLRQAMLDAGFQTAWALSQAAKVNNAQIGNYLNLKQPPLNLQGEWRVDILRIAGALNRLPEQLFPAGFLTQALARNTVTRTMDAAEVYALTSSPRNAEKMLIADEALGDLERALGRLTPRQERVLVLLFGLRGVRSHTLEEIGEMLHVGRERVRAISLQAQRKLKHKGLGLEQVYRTLIAATAEDKP